MSCSGSDAFWGMGNHERQTNTFAVFFFPLSSFFVSFSFFFIFFSFLFLLFLSHRVKALWTRAAK